VPVLQGAIQEVRSIATELRPSSLDELGLLPTINWYCREFERLHEEIAIEREIALQESTIPVPLKIVIYRIIESTLKNIAHYSGTNQIRLALQRAGDKIHLRISHTPDERPSGATQASHDPGFDPQFRFVEMMERATLSGGTFRATRNEDGWVMLHASWAC
jgi:signal transduction histidine kinase